MDPTLLSHLRQIAEWSRLSNYNKRILLNILLIAEGTRKAALFSTDDLAFLSDTKALKSWQDTFNKVQYYEFPYAGKMLAFILLKGETLDESLRAALQDTTLDKKEKDLIIGKILGYFCPRKLSVLDSQVIYDLRFNHNNEPLQIESFNCAPDFVNEGKRWNLLSKRCNAYGDTIHKLFPGGWMDCSARKTFDLSKISLQTPTEPSTLESEEQRKRKRSNKRGPTWHQVASILQKNQRMYPLPFIFWRHRQTKKTAYFDTEQFIPLPFLRLILNPISHCESFSTPFFILIAFFQWLIHEKLILNARELSELLHLPKAIISAMQLKWPECAAKDSKESAHDRPEGGLTETPSTVIKTPSSTLITTSPATPTLTPRATLIKIHFLTVIRPPGLRSPPTGGVKNVCEIEVETYLGVSVAQTEFKAAVGELPPKREVEHVEHAEAKEVTSQPVALQSLPQQSKCDRPKHPILVLKESIEKWLIKVLKTAQSIPLKPTLPKLAPYVARPQGYREYSYAQNQKDRKNRNKTWMRFISTFKRFRLLRQTCFWNMRCLPYPRSIQYLISEGIRKFDKRQMLGNSRYEDTKCVDFSGNDFSAVSDLTCFWGFLENFHQISFEDCTLNPFLMEFLVHWITSHLKSDYLAYIYLTKSGITKELFTGLSPDLQVLLTRKVVF